ncbi:CAP domain-containing protein [Chungangia koreensis]|uniref:CAP domain-containing protein n=1 Tax=Chungangia koreensis TaxID=752657 RepID=A0ABV8X7P4_9LACT
MKKWLPIIMLSTAIVTPGLNAEASSFDHEYTKEYKVWNSDTTINFYVNGEVKKISTDLNSLEDLKASKAALQNLLAQLQGFEGNSFNFENGKVTEQQAPKREVVKESPKAEKAPSQEDFKAEKAPVKEAPKAEQPKQAAPAPSNTQQARTETQAPKAEEKPATQGIGDFEQQVLDLTNAERAKEGLKPLAIDMPLMNSAEEKSADMAKNGYFDHNSPTLGSPFDQMKANGIDYRSAGENIAKGQRTPEEVVKAWMESPGHRANIMKADFTHIGIGYVENGNVWTQQFIQK